MKLIYATCLASLIVSVGGTSFASAQSHLPTGEQIAKAAKAARLNLAVAATAEKYGRRVTVTPIDFSKINTAKNLEKWQVIAVVDATCIPGLRNGRHDVLVARLSGQWHAFFETGGKIVSENGRLEVSSKTDGAKTVNLRPVITMPPPGFVRIFASVPLLTSFA
jgi:hypothetical protein